MNHFYLSILFLFTSLSIQSQISNTQRISDWDNLKSSGFYETLGGSNLPSTASWHWGINIGHTQNTNTPNKYFGAQIVFPVVGSSMDLPKMYIRSTNIDGIGTWAKVLLDKGDQSISGRLGIGTNTPQYQLDVNGEIRSTGIYLNRNESTKTSDISYQGNGLRILAPQGSNAHNWISIYPGTYNGNDTRFTLLNLYTSNGLTQYESKVQIHTYGITYFNGGNVGIGTDNPQNKLDVAGTIRATEVKVETGWADFVFNKDYKLRTLDEVKAHIDEHKHLPDMPSETKVKEDGGVGLGEMQVKLLQKIEELTLYMIQQDKTLAEQGKLIKEQSIRINNLEKK